MDPHEAAGVAAQRSLRRAEHEQAAEDGDDGAARRAGDHPRLCPARKVTAPPEPLQGDEEREHGDREEGEVDDQPVDLGQRRHAARLRRFVPSALLRKVKSSPGSAAKAGASGRLSPPAPVLGASVSSRLRTP